MSVMVTISATDDPAAAVCPISPVRSLGRKPVPAPVQPRGPCASRPELIHRNGLYAELFRLQANAYR